MTTQPTPFQGRVERTSDQSVTVSFLSCRLASEFERSLSGIRPTPTYTAGRPNGDGTFEAVPVAAQEPHRCEDCPPAGYPTDKTRCAPCDRRAAPVAQEPVAWTLSQQQVMALAEELICGAQTMGGADDEGVESDVRLMVRMPGTVADDDGNLNVSPIMAFCIDDYPEEGVYPIDPNDCRANRTPPPQPPTSAQPSTGDNAWRDIFWEAAKILKCLPSTFVDANDHVLNAARKLAAQPAGADPTLPYEQALSTLIDKIIPGLDGGDILADAETASAALTAEPVVKESLTTAEPVKVPSATPRLYQHTDGRYGLSFGPAKFAINEPEWYSVPLDVVEAPTDGQAQKKCTWANVHPDCAMAQQDADRVDAERWRKLLALASTYGDFKADNITSDSWAVMRRDRMLRRVFTCSGQDLVAAIDAAMQQGGQS